MENKNIFKNYMRVYVHGGNSLREKKSSVNN